VGILQVELGQGSGREVIAGREDKVIYLL